MIIRLLSQYFAATERQRRNGQVPLCVASPSSDDGESNEEDGESNEDLDKDKDEFKELSLRPSLCPAQ